MHGKLCNNISRSKKDRLSILNLEFANYYSDLNFPLFLLFSYRYHCCPKINIK